VQQPLPEEPLDFFISSVTMTPAEILPHQIEPGLE
jgi:hypothetical protein